MFVVGSALAGLLAVGAAQATEAAPPSKAAKRPPAASARVTQRPLRVLPRSVGSPTRGTLEGGIALPATPHVALRNALGARWGLPSLVGLLERSARRVGRLHAGSVLLVGDLSTRHGGRLGGHRSHQSGRDADVGFYYSDARGRSVLVRSFLRVGDDGRVIGRPALRFDDARNWALVESWIIDPEARVQHVFVAAPLRQRLLAQARSVAAYPPVLHRAALLLKQPSRGLAHDDHFHVRIACPRDQRDGCVPEPESEDVASWAGKAGSPLPSRDAESKTRSRDTG